MRVEGTYLITGGAGGLGRVVAPVFRRAGARVVLLDSPRSDVVALARTLDAEAVVVDLLQMGEAAAAIETVGPVAGLIHLAGGFAKHAACAADDALFDALLGSNLRTLFNAVRAVLPGMLSRGEGFIAGVATNLVWKRGAGAEMTLYAAAKGAVAHYLAALDAEVRAAGVRVTVLYPLSSIDTPANRSATPEIDPATWVDPEEIAEALLFAATRGPRGHLVELPMTSVYSSRAR